LSCRAADSIVVSILVDQFRDATSFYESPIDRVEDFFQFLFGLLKMGPMRRLASASASSSVVGRMNGFEKKCDTVSHIL
jgi:hypothetical protein